MMVSVLVPIYNKSPKELTRCFESILKQTHRDFELIITDDGSKPDVGMFLDEYTENNKTRCLGGVSCYHYPNGGVWSARNRGQEKAAGEWIMHVNADDFISPMVIETALQAAAEHENVDMVYWGFMSADWPPYLYKGCGGDRLYSDPTGEKFHIRQDILCATPFCDVTCMVRREKAQPFRPELTGAEFEHQVRMAAGCRAVYFIDRPFYTYVPSKNTISSSQANINWRIDALGHFRDAFVSHGYKTVDEYLIVYAVDIIHYAAAGGDVSLYREVDKSVAGQILRSMPIKKYGPMTRNKRIICALFKARQFRLLHALLRFARSLKQKGDVSEAENTQGDSSEEDVSANGFHPLVSIIIPVYNGAEFLRDAIDCALNQTYGNIEVIVVNDGSTDNTEQIALFYGDKIRYFAKENGGIPTALNVGIKNMRGEYFSCLSQDSLYFPRKIEREVEELSTLPDKNILLLCDWDTLDANGKPLRLSINNFYQKEYYSNGKSEVLLALYYHNYCYCAMLVPKACVIASGAFDVNLHVAYGHEFVSRVLDKFSFKWIPEPLSFSRSALNLRGKFADTRSNVEFSLLLIDITDRLTEEEILKTGLSKRDFYLSLWDTCHIAGFTIVREYVRVIAVSLGYIKKNARMMPTPPRRRIFKRLIRALKVYGLKETFRRLLAKFNR